MKTQGGSGTARRRLYGIVWAVMLLISTLTFPQRVEALPYPLVAECKASSNTGVTDVSCSITTSANHLLVVLFMGNGGTCNATPSDTFSLSWIQNSFGCAGPATQFINVYEAKTASNSGSTTVDVHAFTGSVQFIEVWDVGLAPASTPNDGGSGASGSGGPATINSGNFSTTVANDVLPAIGYSASCSSSLGGGTGYTRVTAVQLTSFCISTEVKVAGAPGTYSASFVQDASGSWIVLGTAYKFTPIQGARMKSQIF